MSTRWSNVRYSLRLVRRVLRTSTIATWLFGYTHKPAEDLLEIDITFACNLKCLNCDRSCTQAADGNRMTLAQIERFIQETRDTGRCWRRIRILGGEPALHPEIDAILGRLVSWRDKESPNTLLELVTNGYGDLVRRVLARVPQGIKVKNTNKESRFQPKFEAFNLAPQDDPMFAKSNFGHGCWITEECGLGLNAHGWYPCAVAGGIDRVLGEGNARASMPLRGDELRQELQRACRSCGHFKAGWWTPIEYRVAVPGEPQSASWREAYRRFKVAKPKLPRYGSDQ